MNKVNADETVELRIMPGGNGDWYWELIHNGRVITRGVADDEPTACKEVGDAAREAKLISDGGSMG
jgi:hypothetical protein